MASRLNTDISDKLSLLDNNSPVLTELPQINGFNEELVHKFNELLIESKSLIIKSKTIESSLKYLNETLINCIERKLAEKIDKLSSFETCFELIMGSERLFETFNQNYDKLLDLFTQQINQLEKQNIFLQKKSNHFNGSDKNQTKDTVIELNPIQLDHNYCQSMFETNI